MNEIDGFVPKEIQDALIEYFEKQDLITHMRDWKVSKIPGLNEYDIDIKIHVNKKED